MGRENALLSSPAPPVPEGPSHLLLLFSPWPPSYAPRASVAGGVGLGGQRTGLGAQQAPWPEWVSKRPPLLQEGPSRLPLLIHLASLLCPQDPHGLEGSLEVGYWPGSSAGSRGQVDREISLRSSLAPPGGPLLPTSPDLPGLRGADPVWPPLLLPPLSPHILLVHLGVPPVSLGISVPHQQPAGSLVVGRR